MFPWSAASGAKGAASHERDRRPWPKQTPGAIGPGRLVLVVGPSGAGKDTLLRLAQAACVDDHDIVFPRRVVTRESSADEDNIAVSPDEFRARAASTAISPCIGRRMGIATRLPLEIDDDIRAGRAVVANVSRTVIGALRQHYANVVVVAITAPPEVLAQRLAARARQQRRQYRRSADAALSTTRRRSRRHHPQCRQRRNITAASLLR